VTRFSRVRSWISVTSGVRFSSQISHLVQRPDRRLSPAVENVMIGSDEMERVISSCLA
jgi:hypothetical protein